MQKLLRDTIRHKVLLSMLLPVTILLLINNYLPMFGVFIAFKNINYAKGIWDSPWVGFKNFEFLFSTSDAWVITRNTIAYNAVFIVLNAVVAIIFAIALNEIKNRWLSKVYQSAMFLPYFLSMVVVSYLVFSFLGVEQGFVNRSILPMFGREAIQWYNEAVYWPYLLPLINLWKNVGYISIVYLAAIIGIDDEYYEAALIDGAGKWQQITRITIPMITPVIIIMTLLAIGKIFNADFGLFYQVPLSSGALFSTTNVIDTYVYRALMNSGDIGMSSAAGLYQAVIGFILVLGANYAVKKVNRDHALF